MISTASDFYCVTGADVDSDHPHGDLDRIDLNWTAWFSRRGVGSAVRGDDIALLMDFAMRRNCMATSYKRLSFGEYQEFGSVDDDGVASAIWPYYEGQVAAEFSRLITPDNFGMSYDKGLYTAFSKMASKVAFFPYQGIDNVSVVMDGYGWDMVKSQLGAMTIDMSGLKSAEDFASTNPPIVASDVQAYANKIFNVAQKYGFFYLGDAGVGATYPNAEAGVSPGARDSGATVRAAFDSWYEGDSGGESYIENGRSRRWGCGEYEYDNSSAYPEGDVRRRQYACGWTSVPTKDTVLFSLVAPHARKVVAACDISVDVFGVSRHLLHTCPMSAKGGGTFELTAASATDGMNPLSLASAVGFPTTVQESDFAYLKDYSCTIDCCVYPIVYLDDAVYNS